MLGQLWFFGGLFPSMGVERGDKLYVVTNRQRLPNGQHIWVLLTYIGMSIPRITKI